MEVRKRVNPKLVFIGLYFIAFLGYLWFGLRPAEATNYEIVAKIEIPSIKLESEVARLNLREHILETPTEIVGSFSRAKNKTLLIGHSSTAFKSLDQASVGAEIIYDEDIYYIYNIYIIPKEEVKMEHLLRAAEKETLVLMTCAGEDLENRLIVVASR